jgi:hypothetical protein
LGKEGDPLGVAAPAKEDEAAELICRFTFLPASSAEILIAERCPEVELELWKFISFPVSERQFLLISCSTPPCGA